MHGKLSLKLYKPQGPNVYKNSLEGFWRSINAANKSKNKYLGNVF